MNNDELDKLFRDKINETKSAEKYTADWDVFSKKLSKSDGFQDINFDAELKSKIVDFSIPFNNKHWELLKQRLIKEENLKRKIFVSSIIESAAVVILLFLFQQYDLDINTQPIEFAQGKNKTSIAKLNAPATDLSAIYSHKAFEYQPRNNESDLPSEETLIDIESQVVLEHPMALPTTKKEIQIYSVAALQQDITNEFAKNMAPSDPSQYPTNKNIDVATETSTTNAEVVLNSTPVNMPIQDAAVVKKRAQVNIAILKDLTFDITSVNLPSSIKFNETDASRYIIPVIGFGQGIIRSSYDKIYNLKAYTIYSSQVTTGAFYAYKKRGVELASGIRYTKKEYNPQKISEFYYDQSNNPSQVSLDKIKYDIIEVPLQFKTYFKQSPVVNFYAKVGSSLNLTLASRYDVNEKDLTYSSFAKKIATTSDGEIISNNAKLSKKEFNPGLLQSGGKIKENAFLTVTGELGLERRINMTNHIVIGAEYAKYFMIEGIGPNNDKFNVFNFNVGLKHKIH